MPIRRPPPRRPRPRTLPKLVAPNVVPFPHQTNDLTPVDVKTMGLVKAALGGGWFFEIRPDDEGKLEAVLGSRSGPSAGVRFSVFQHGERLVFVQLATGNPPPAGIIEGAVQSEASEREAGR